MSTKNKKQSGLKTAAEVTAGLGLAAAAGVGTYLMIGKHGEKNRKKLKVFAAKVQREAMEEYKMMKGANEAAYKRAVAMALSHYKQFREVDKPEIKRIISDLHGQWKEMSRKMKEAPAKKSGHMKPKAKKTAKK
jgi:hypothetical protein